MLLEILLFGFTVIFIALDLIDLVSDQCALTQQIFHFLLCPEVCRANRLLTKYRGKVWPQHPPAALLIDQIEECTGCSPTTEQKDDPCLF